MTPTHEPEAPRNCPRCPRLVAYRMTNAALEPGWFNGPAPSFGDSLARLLIVGLAPGRSGANRTGRPFTGDYAGRLLYGTLLELGLAEGVYGEEASDGLRLKGVMITNAVRCAPPDNKPDTLEIGNCLPFLKARIAALPNLKVVLALGVVAHGSSLRAYGLSPNRHRFAHGAEAMVCPTQRLISSFHCSRYNTNTGKLTTDMFRTVVSRAWHLAS